MKRPMVVSLLISLTAILLLVAAGCGAGKGEVPDVTGQGLDTAATEVQDAGFKVAIQSKAGDAALGIVLAQDPAGGQEAEKDKTTVTLTTSLGPTSVPVPDVVGLTVDQAKNALFAAGFKSNEFAVPSPAPKGAVVAQAPAAGQVAEVGSDIRINVSGGSGTATVPDVVGKSAEDATAEVQAAGLMVFLDGVQSDQESGTVVAQSPAANTKQKGGSTVTLAVSRGTGTVTMPNVEAEPATRAVTSLEQLGLNVNVISVPSDLPVGTVIAQNPGAGKKIAVGSLVRINISGGRA